MNDLSASFERKVRDADPAAPAYAAGMIRTHMNSSDWVTLLILAATWGAAFLFIGLGLNPREVPSPLVGKPAPTFRLAQLAQPNETFSPSQMHGQV